MPDPTLSDHRRHSTTTTSDSEKAWNLLSTLLTLRRPATPEELASRCRFSDATPELVLRLCSIPNSPICSTEEDDGLVTVAVAALSALDEFAPEARKVMELFVLRCYYPNAEFRKRKAESESEAVPIVKRRLQFRNEDAGEGDEILACHRNLLIEGNERNERGLGPLLLDFNAELADLQLTLYEHEEEGDAAVWPRALMREESPQLLDTYNVPKPIMVDRGEGCFVDLNLPPLSSNQDAWAEKADAFGKAPTHCVYSESTVNVIALEKDQNMKTAETKTDFLSAECSPEKQAANSYGKLEGTCTNLPSQERFIVESLEDNDVVNTPKQQVQCKSGQRSLSVENKLKNNNRNSMHQKENKVDAAFITPKLERIKLPHFEDFVIEEEEGSGGYGTVYRAQRKNDRKRFAIKCPHDKAHKHHVENERKMLERFGGRSFIIKYEGSFRRGDSDCFILEHVEHDRPEVLKKKIGLYELQWYGYCMFRALACLHKQGVVHRYVKPGNFLYSRKLKKGYLIDFNLAMLSAARRKLGFITSSHRLIFPNLSRFQIPRPSLHLILSLNHRLGATRVEDLKRR